MIPGAMKGSFMTTWRCLDTDGNEVGTVEAPETTASFAVVAAAAESGATANAAGEGDTTVESAETAGAGKGTGDGDEE